MDDTENGGRTVDSDMKHFRGYNPARTMMMVMGVTPGLTIWLHMHIDDEKRNSMR
jgi:hypothetical protein